MVLKKAARYDEYNGPGDYPQTGDEEQGLAVLRAIERSKRSSYRRRISVLQALSEEGLARSGNTSNLKAHLKNNHKIVHCQLQKPSAPIIPKVRMPAITPLTQELPYGHRSKRYKELNEAVAYFICMDNLPIYTVEKPGFRLMVKKLDSRYEIPSRAHFSRSIIPDLYTSTKQKVTRDT